MKKKFLAKLLVLCMAVSMLPAAAISVGAAGTKEAKTSSCNFTAASSTGGSAYVVAADASTAHKLGNTAYQVATDTATIKLVPDDGYKAVLDKSEGSSYYTYKVTEDATAQYVYITKLDTEINVANFASVEVHPVFD